MEMVEGENCAVAWFDPENVGSVAAVGHRKNSRSIALQEHVRIKQSGHRRSVANRDRVIASSSVNWLNRVKSGS